MERVVKCGLPFVARRLAGRVQMGWVLAMTQGLPGKN